MRPRETAEEIDAQAAQWVVRVDDAGDDAPLHAELEQWLQGDTRRRGAYLRACATWMMVGRVCENGEQSQRSAPGFNASDARQANAALSRRRILGAGGALATCLAVGAIYALWPATPTWIETSVGEIRRVPLRDGSIASINTGSRIAVLLEDDSRHVELIRGEAWFQVAKDRARPFVVEGGDARVRAVGTGFSVRRYIDGIAVLVTEGVVEVSSPSGTGHVYRIPAGARSFIRDGSGPSAPVSADDEIERELAWRSGQLIFDGTPLWKAAKEFNRYNVMKLTVNDNALGQERLVGRFQPNDPAVFARAVAKMLDAEVETRGNSIEISRMR